MSSIHNDLNEIMNLNEIIKEKKEKKLKNKNSLDSS